MSLHIHFIGFGNLAKAIAQGLIKQNKYNISASAPSLSSGANTDGIQMDSNNTQFLSTADVVILAVKPINMSKIMSEIAPRLAKDCLIISVAAGLSLEWFAKYLPPSQPIIRTMPNTPAAIGLAATPMIANRYVNDQQKQWAEAIFSSIGITSWTQHEENMDTFTALSGSGPAYVFLFMESMIAAGVSLGLQESDAKTFTFQTITGALQLASQSKLNLKELRDKVTSPGGTTAAALDILNPDMMTLMLEAMRAAKKRSEELGQIY